MHDHSDRLSKKLLALEDEHTTPSLRERYEREVRSLIEQRLSRWQWLRYVGLLVVGSVGGGGCLLLVLTEPAGLRPLTRAALMLCALFSLSWAALATVVLRRGAIHRRHRGAAARMAFGFTLTMVMVFSAVAAASPKPMALVTLMAALALLIVAAVVLVLDAIEQASLRGREQSLAVELRLAQLGEARVAGDAKG